MYYRCVVVGLMVILFAGCDHQKETAEELSYKNTQIENVLSSFCPSGLCSETLIDSNTFIFVKDSRFDTLFTLILHKEDTIVRGVYYEGTPDNIALSNQTKGLLFFEGFSFNMDFLKWKQMIEKSHSLLTKSSNEPMTGCLDCPYYILATGSQRVSNGRKTMKEFKEYEYFLKQNVIRPIKKYKQFLQ